MSREDKQSEEAREEREDEDAREAEDEGDEDEAKASKSSDDSSDESESDEAAARVAKALGVSGDEEASAEGDGAEGAEAEAEEEEQKAAKPNRAQRRREEAMARRKKRAGGASASESSSEDEDAALPKDKNARAKELLKRRKEQAAAAERRPVASALDAGEMVDDALARSASAVTKWLKSNLQLIQYVILAGIVVGGGYAFYVSRSEKTSGEASAQLAAGVAADRGVVMEEDKRSDEQKEYDPTRVFKTADEKAQAELDAFGKVVDQHAGTGAALLAKLGQAGAYLEKKDYDKALAAYSEVLNSKLAAADPDVKGRATEGIGFAKEGKGDLDGALASFKELAVIDVKGYKDLATYHEARILFAKGEKDKAKELLVPLDKKMQEPSKDPQPEFVKDAVHDLLTQIDPSAVTSPHAAGLGGMPSAADIQEMARRAKQNAEKKASEQK